MDFDNILVALVDKRVAVSSCFPAQTLEIKNQLAFGDVDLRLRLKVARVNDLGDDESIKNSG